MINYRSIRFRLTVWYTSVLIVGLGLFAVGSNYALGYAIASSKHTVLLRRERRFEKFFDTTSKGPSVQSFVDAAEQFAKPAAQDDLLQVFGGSGYRLYPASGPVLRWPGQNHACASPCFGRMIWNGVAFATMAVDYPINGNTKLRIYMSSSLEEHMDIVRHYRIALSIVLTLLGFLSVALGYVLSRRALQPVDDLTRHSLKISIGNLGERLPVPNTGDELQRLAEGWNVLLSKLQGAVEQLTQFTADVSHDLRTSLTVMLTTSQLALKRPRSESEYQEALAMIERECQDTAQLLDDLLTLARAEAYLQRIRRSSVNLSELANDSCRRVQAIAQARSQQLTWKTPADGMRIFGNAALLRRLIGILLDNAMKYTPENGSIYVCVTRQQESVQLSVRDTGIGIPEDLSPRVFDRFVRGDSARRSQSGHGLGLSIAKWIVDAHEGQISFGSTINSGTTFTIVFPASS